MTLASLPLDLLFYVISGLGAIAAFLWKGLGSIPEGEYGVKCRWGKALRKKNGEIDVRGPGLVILIPLVDTIAKRNVREQTINLVNQNVTLADGFVATVSAAVLFRVVDIYKALFAVDNIFQGLENMALKVIQEGLRSKTYADLSGEEGLSKGALPRLQKIATRWGAEILEFGLTDIGILAEQAHLISMRTGVEMKAGALKYLAEQMGCGSIVDLNPGLAAAFIGTPLVSTIATKNSIDLGAVSPTGLDDDGGQSNLSSMIQSVGQIVKQASKKVAGS